MKKHQQVILAVALILFAWLGLGKLDSLDFFVPAQAAQLQELPPTITAIDPSAALNDLDTPVVIRGSGFSVEVTGTVVLTAPTAYLGGAPLADVTWVSSTTITATVPWGMDSGVYTLTLTNPDGAAGFLTRAFTVTQGIGQWNNGDLFGGEVRQLMLKPGDPDTLYALAYNVGLFRSRDGAENWEFISNNVNGNGTFVIDPLHPTWLYTNNNRVIERSIDEGDTWTVVLDEWPGGAALESGRVFPSIHDPGVMFISAAHAPGSPVSGARGLIKSVDGGNTWTVISSMVGIPVIDLDYHPTDPLQMVLGTQTGQVFRSTDGGEHWAEVLKPPVDYVGTIRYNPYLPSEVWVSFGWDTGLYKSIDANFSAWQDVTPAGGWGDDLWFVKFASATSVYTVRLHSPDGGSTWQPYGEWDKGGEISFNPTDPQVAYLGHAAYGVEKTLDGGSTWEIKSQGLTGMRALQIQASLRNPQLVFATFEHWAGVYRSYDGASTWDFLPMPNSFNVRVAREDPFNLQRIFVASDPGFYLSEDGGASWSSLGWNVPPGSPLGCPNALEPDPYEAGHILAGFQTAGDNFFFTLKGAVYSSSDYGLTWTPISVVPGEDIARIVDIAFHPDTPGLVYLSTDGTGLYRSTDSGLTWERIDDPDLYYMQWTGSIAIATHPDDILVVTVGNTPHRSYDGGDTWEPVEAPYSEGNSSYMFVDYDSTRLYASTWSGLLWSTDAGTSWQRAAGTLGRVHVSAMGYGMGDTYDVLYVATSGGDLGAASSLQANAPQNNWVEAGVYRYVQRQLQLFLPIVNYGK